MGEPSATTDRNQRRRTMATHTHFTDNIVRCLNSKF